jgi:hypothetical protein
MQNNPALLVYISTDEANKLITACSKKQLPALKGKEKSQQLLINTAAIK